MRILDKKAVSRLILIILMLCAAVFGAIMSYLLVMSSYYNTSERVIVEGVVFPISDFTYFNVTILNPSNSASDVNVTTIHLSVEGRDEAYNITDTEPELGIIRPGIKQTFKCKKNWSNFTGENVRIELMAKNASTAGYSVVTPKAKLILTSNFETTPSIEYFNLTVQNSVDSIVNLSLSEVLLFGMPINENVTPSLTPPLALSPGQSEKFQCNCSWENYMREKVRITVKTTEGYESVYTTDEVPGAVLFIDEVKFDSAHTTYFNLNIKSSEESTAEAIFRGVNLTLEEGVSFAVNTTIPPVGTSIPRNQSLPIMCFWTWTYYRDKNVTFEVYTARGFSVPSKTTRTPSDVIFNMTDITFDLDHTNYFLVNVTNMPYSLRNITITRIELDAAETSSQSQTIPIGEERTFNCTFEWKDRIGDNVNITVLTEDESKVSRLVPIPSAELKFLDMAISEMYIPDLNTTRPYINLTISNSKNSNQNMTITKIIFETQNATFEIYGALTYPEIPPDGYILAIGENASIACLWNWDYLGLSLKITIGTAEGFEVSRTWHIPKP